VIPTIAPYLLPLFLKKFSEKHPKLIINVEELQTHQILERLKNNSLDLALLVTPIEDDKLQSHPLFYEPFMIYMSEKNNLFSKQKMLQADLSASDMWMLTEGHCFRDQTLAVCKNRKKVIDEKKNIKFESGSLETLKRMVDQENGFTLMPYLATLDMSHSKKIKEFATPVPTREVSLIHSVFFKRDTLKQSLCDVIQSSLPKDISLLKTKNTQVIDLPIGAK
jgi:LysR family hydrogen peroxide-inducible transcriptional activator